MRPLGLHEQVNTSDWCPARIRTSVGAKDMRPAPPSSMASSDLILSTLHSCGCRSENVPWQFLVVPSCAPHKTPHAHREGQRIRHTNTLFVLTAHEAGAGRGDRGAILYLVQVRLHFDVLESLLHELNEGTGRHQRPADRRLVHQALMGKRERRMLKPCAPATASPRATRTSAHRFAGNTRHPSAHLRTPAAAARSSLHVPDSCRYR